MQRRDALRTLVGCGAAVAGAQSWLPSTVAAETPSATSDRKRSVRFAHFTDMHVYAKRNAPEGLAKAIRHMQALSDPPEFVLNGGDAIYDALEVTRDEADGQWSLWSKIWTDNSSLPMRHCLGNHDVWGWNKGNSKTTGKEAGWGKQLALDRLGLEKSYHRFDAGGWRFIVLDSMTFDEQTVYRAELDPEQFAWLKNELKSVPAAMPVAIVSHIPILTVGTIGFTPEVRKHPEANKVLSHVDAYELLMLLRQFPNVKLCLSGHTHQTENISFGSLDFVNSGAVCGLWWKGKFDQTAEGYNVIDFYDDGTAAANYHSYGWNAQG